MAGVFFAATLFIAVGPGIKTALASGCATNPRLNGSFMQPTLPDGFGSLWWNSELGYMQNACLGQLVLQWSADSKTYETTYPTSLSGWVQGTSTDVVGLGLTAADAKGVSVYVGLNTNSDWFTKHADDTTFLSNQATIANQLADEIWHNYGTHSSFAGWYFPFEVDNFFFTTTTEWDNLVTFLNTVFNHVHSATSKPIIIAPFFNTSGGQTSSQWQTMWAYILQRTSIDTIALQDGVGVGHATASQLPSWFSATQSAISSGHPSTQLWADTETLTIDSQTSPITQSMAIGTVVADMQAVQSYVSDFLSFSYNHYDSPNQVANEYDATYRNYLTNATVESTPPTTPGTPSATATNSITINISWAASCDDIGVVGYKIYRNGSLVWNVYTNGYSVPTSFTDSQLNPSTTYTYTVAAFDAAGNASAQSASGSATTLAGTTYPTNLALHKTYTASFPAGADTTTYPDTTPTATKLTDGTYAAQPPLLSDSAWRGVNTAGTYSYTIDLGSVQTIHELNSDWFQYVGASVFLPGKVVWAVSNDGSTFTNVGTVTKPAVTTDIQTKKYRLIDLSNVSGRYVKITVTPPSAAWTFIDEAEVRQ